jgi:hypothetical protein
MQEISTNHVAKLASIASQLSSLVDAIRGSEIEVPADVQAKVERYIAAGACLRCGKKKGGRYTRGQCVSCYNTTNSEINRGASEAELIRNGRLAAEAKKGGRKSITPPLSELGELPPLDAADSDTGPAPAGTIRSAEKRVKAKAKK